MKKTISLFSPLRSWTQKLVSSAFPRNVKSLRLPLCLWNLTLPEFKKNWAFQENICIFFVEDIDFLKLTLKYTVDQISYLSLRFDILHKRLLYVRTVLISDTQNFFHSFMVCRYCSAFQLLRILKFQVSHFRMCINAKPNGKHIFLWKSRFHFWDYVYMYLSSRQFLK